MQPVKRPTTTPAPLGHLNMHAVGGRRLCGAGRTAGSVYVESAQPIGGTPIEQYLNDPPIEIAPEQLNLAPMGVSIIEINGVGHILDWVGSTHYQMPADFIEEARRMGVSRKISRTTDLSKITAQSTIMLVHSKAVMTNPRVAQKNPQVICPNGQHAPGEACSALHWLMPDPLNIGRRPLSSGDYETVVHHGPDPEYTTGIFMTIPISGLTIIRHHDGSVDMQAQETVERSGFLPHIADL